VLGDKEQESWSIYPKKNVTRIVDLSKGNMLRSPSKNSISNTSVLKRKIQRFRNNAIGFLGLHYAAQRNIVSKELIAWIDNFNPDCIYTNLHNYSFMKFIDELVRLKNIPLIIHIMDDWMPSIEPKGILRKYWLYKTDGLFRKLIHKAKLNLSICQYMSDEYQVRYNVKFIPFHNCVDFNAWIPTRRIEQSFLDTFVVLYAGRIGPGTTSSVVDIANSIEELASEGLNIRYHVQSSVIPDDIRSKLMKLEHTEIKGYVDYNELPLKFAQANLLVLPMDSDDRNLSYIRLSMPTKAPEYMICGTPVLVYAPQNTALYNYSEKMKWSFSVKGNDLLSLKNALRNLYTDEQVRMQLSSQAYHIAQINHDSLHVRKEFQEALSC
jgi:glycosyltransferase involved in cell wall biosynthesis